MSSNLAMSAMSGLEFILSALLGLLFWKKGLQHRFPAMSKYLALRIISAPVLFVLLSAATVYRAYVSVTYTAYFFLYWAVYAASAALLFFICMEVFRAALSGFSGLARLGTVVFRWAAVVSLILTFSSASYAHRGLASIPDIATSLMRSVSIIELCLLAFLCLSMNALNLSARDLGFGIALGFGVMASNDFLVISLISHHASLAAPLQFAYQGVMLAGIGTWIAYAALPEPVRKPLVIPATSTVYRWNEIASALGHSGAKIAVQQPANGFFLTDVEKVVDKVLARNLKESESSS